MDMFALGDAVLEVPVEPAPQIGRIDMVEAEGFRNRDIVRIVHVPVAARRRERVVRIGEGELHEEGPVGRLRVFLQQVARGLPDIARGIELFGHPGAPGLGRRNAAGIERVGPPAQRIRVVRSLQQPAGIVAVRGVAVPGHQTQIVEAVIGRFHDAVRIGDEAFGPLDLVARSIDRAPVRFGQFRRRPAAGRRRGIVPVLHRDGRHVLEMGFADHRRAVALVAQQVHEGDRFQRQGQAVGGHAVRARHLAGHDGRPVRHADRAGDVEAVERQAAGGDGIDVRGPDDVVAVTAQMIRAVLVRDDENDIGLFGTGHGKAFAGTVSAANRVNGSVCRRHTEAKSPNPTLG